MFCIIPHTQATCLLPPVLCEIYRTVPKEQFSKAETCGSRMQVPFDDPRYEVVVPLPSQLPAAASNGRSSPLHHANKQLRVVTRTEGPLIVLSIIDVSKHPPEAAGLNPAYRPASPNRLWASLLKLMPGHQSRTSPTGPAGAKPSTPAADRRGVAGTDRSLAPSADTPAAIDVCLDFAGVGLSLASEGPRELLYACARGLAAELQLGGEGRSVGGSCSISSFLLDDPDLDAQYVAVIEAPVLRSLFSLVPRRVSRVDSADGGIRKRGGRQCVRIRGWFQLDPQRGLMARDVALDLAPMAVNIDGQRVEAVRQALQSLMSVAQAPLLPHRYEALSFAAASSVASSSAGDASPDSLHVRGPGAVCTGSKGVGAVVPLAAPPHHASAPFTRPLVRQSAAAVIGGAAVQPRSVVPQDLELLLGRTPVSALQPATALLEGSLKVSSVEFCISVEPHESW